jgi:acyl carrier protein
MSEVTPTIAGPARDAGSRAEPAVNWAARPAGAAGPVKPARPGGPAESAKSAESAESAESARAAGAAEADRGAAEADRGAVEADRGAVEAVEERVLAEVAATLREVIGEDYALDLDITMATTFYEDLELESIEFVNLAGRMRQRYGDRVNFVGFLAAFEHEQIRTMCVGDIVSYIADSLVAGSPVAGSPAAPADARTGGGGRVPAHG